MSKRVLNLKLQDEIDDHKNIAFTFQFTSDIGFDDAEVAMANSFVNKVEELWGNTYGGFED